MKWRARIDFFDFPGSDACDADAAAAALRLAGYTAHRLLEEVSSADA
jgi:hypothetical protein